MIARRIANLQEAVAAFSLLGKKRCNSLIKFCRKKRRQSLFMPPCVRSRALLVIGSSAKKTWRLNNVKATSNYWFNDNLDAGNPAVGIRCVKNYKVKK